MTVTDELRRMLDERGVEHYDGTENTLWGYEDYNEFTGIYRFSADETSDGRMQVRLWHATPAQAIEATLGRGTTTRHGKYRTKYGRSVPCCECCGYGIGDERWHYCPSCGAEVVG